MASLIFVILTAVAEKKRGLFKVLCNPAIRLDAGDVNLMGSAMMGE